MKRLLKLFVLAMTLVVTASCSAQYRAQKHIRRAVELCPELVQKKAVLIDTAMCVPGYTDTGLIPLSKLLESDTVYYGTEHGAITASLNKQDSIITIYYTADPIVVQYHDTVYCEQVKQSIVVSDKPQRYSLGEIILLCIICFGFGMVLTLWLLRHAIKR